MLYAFGLPGQKVRTYIDTDPIDAGRQRRPGEAVVAVEQAIVDALVSGDGTALVSPAEEV